MLHSNTRSVQHDELEALRSEVQALVTLGRQLLARADAMSRAVQPKSDPTSLAGLPCKRRVDKIVADLGRQKASQLFTRGARRLQDERRKARLNGNGHASAVAYDLTV